MPPKTLKTKAPAACKDRDAPRCLKLDAIGMGPLVGGANHGKGALLNLESLSWEVPFNKARSAMCAFSARRTKMVYG